ncbi:MAG: thiol reductase thioredoxin [Parcubacteria group bacterium]|nr:thiol reductase thioredoxin [Parcubacteria group bacterium]|tara:strand:- start:2741 stop:3019 length:279 start_codon:yes stop_codon:yes gene_type:complete
MRKKLLYYTAKWCGPCRMFKPVILALINEGYNIEIIDVDENVSEAKERRVSSVPTLIFTEKNKQDRRFSGAMPPDQIKSELEDGGKYETIDV